MLLEVSDYILMDNVLYHARVTRSKRNKLMSPYQLVIPTAMIPQVLKLAHDSPLGGHSGINNTINRVKEFFYFPRMGKIITDYVHSYHDCQTRKVSNMKTKSKIAAYPTPAQPFQVCQIDLFGPLPPSPTGNIYIFTAIDMFSKFLYALPIRNKDVATVSQAIFSLTTNYGVCQTLVSDQRKEFTGKCTRKVCSLLGLKQEFIPSFIHHCLGACERTHRTIAERLTPYVQDNIQWENVLPAVVFSINSSFNSSSLYSPFEILYGQRPHFPLTNMLPVTNFQGVPQSLHSYMSTFCDKLRIIREAILTNIEKSQKAMEQRENSRLCEIKLTTGDYVYLSKELTGQGRKLKPNFDGPYIVHEIVSDHLIKLRDPSGKRTFHSAVHINRLKIAHDLAPNPQPYLQHSIYSDISSSHEDTDDKVNNTETEQNDSNEWLPLSQLPPKAHEMLVNKPPPLID